MVGAFEDDDASGGCIDEVLFGVGGVFYIDNVVFVALHEEDRAKDFSEVGLQVFEVVF